MKAYLNLRYTVQSRVDSFIAGLNALGFAIGNRLDSDIFVTWNRVADSEKIAQQFEAAGKPVIVAENASWGNEFLGGKWHTLALGRHNTAGCFPVGDNSRWDNLGVTLAPWRCSTVLHPLETVVLGQRGIGAYGMPRDWPSTVKHLGRYRPHPGRGTGIPLEHDLRNCGKVITWGSGAAVKALMWGIKVESHMPSWIGRQGNCDESRLEMFRRMAWCNWQLDEIATGEPFRRLLAFSPRK